MQLLYVMLGGAIGSGFRYLISILFTQILGTLSIWGTLSVNLIGAALIGLAMGTWGTNIVGGSLHLLLVVGLLGGFTTFSTFALEIQHLFKNGEWTTLIIYWVLTNALGLGLAYLGYQMGEKL